MDNNEIKKILNDLYSIDPSLRDHEKELFAVIRTMAITPEAHYDPAAAGALRAKLLDELARNAPARRRGLSEIFAFGTMRYAIVAAAMIAIGVVAFAGLRPGSGPVAFNSPGVAITKVGDNAFGSLSALSTSSGAERSLTSNTNSAVAPMASAPSSASDVGAVSASAGAGTNQSAPNIVIARPIPAPYISPNRYAYTGDPISQPNAQLNVLKKSPAPLNGAALAAALKQAGFEQIDISSFSNVSMSTVTFSEDQKFGYQVSIDFVNGTISINQNYSEWPQGGTSPLSASDIPSDSAVIAIASQFLSAHGILTGAYGTPKVTRNNFYAEPLSASGGAVSNMPMIPYYSDSEQVVYPLLVNGENVYDAGGNEIGMTVEVNVRYNRVASVYGLEAQSYQSSAYDAITDASTIISMAENAGGGIYPIIYNQAKSSALVSGGPAINTTVYDLGTPTMAYEEMYQTDAQGASAEYLVPAFVFPVIGDVNSGAQRNVIVPLVKDFEDQTVTPPRATPGSGGSAVAPTPMLAPGSAGK
jgi:hypothetical protein